MNFPNPLTEKNFEQEIRKSISALVDLVKIDLNFFTEIKKTFDELGEGMELNFFSQIFLKKWKNHAPKNILNCLEKKEREMLNNEIKNKAAKIFSAIKGIICVSLDAKPVCKKCDYTQICNHEFNKK